jgi:hypothetical protein
MIMLLIYYGNMCNNLGMNLMNIDSKVELNVIIDVFIF